jgi:formate dehydrogenase maturation protein FdhE
MAQMPRDQWRRRAERARQLSAVRPAARQLLDYYARLADVQHDLVTRHRSAESARPELFAWLRANAPNPGGQDSMAWEHVAREALGQAFVSADCPECGGPPVVSLLREASHGARRSHVCGLCLKESSASRLGCLACGEQRVDALPVYRADDTDPARIDACDSCRTYLKTIDLTRDGAADPIVDDIASVALDLWARQLGYRRERDNVLRL